MLQDFLVTILFACLILDDIVRRKLLVDGDGGGDDKRLVSLLKLVIDFCNDQEDSPQEWLAFEQYFPLDCHLKTVTLPHIVKY